MAHAGLHLAVGMTAGLAVMAPRIARTWRAGRPLARVLGTTLGMAWGLGLLSIVPSLIRHLGVPESVSSGWWMNLFLFHPLLNRLFPRGNLLGQASLVACLALQYALVVSAVARARRQRTTPPPS